MNSYEQMRFYVFYNEKTRQNEIIWITLLLYE